jgi:hypothetical protein
MIFFEKEFTLKGQVSLSTLILAFKRRFLACKQNLYSVTSKNRFESLFEGIEKGASLQASSLAGAVKFEFYIIITSSLFHIEIDTEYGGCFYEIPFECNI